MSLRTTELGLTLIRAFEGCKLKAYKCPAGKWTVGYGHTSAAGGLAVGPTTTLSSKAEAEKLLAADIDRFEDHIETLLAGAEIEDHQFDALVSLAFNIGVGNFAASTVLKKIKARDFDAVPANLMKWNKITDPKTKAKVESTGLTRRRRAEAALWRGDLEDAETYMGISFGPMPQAVEPPAPPKTMAQSKSGNASIVTGGVGATLGVKAILDSVQEITAPVGQLTATAQEVTTGLQTTVQQGQSAVQATHEVAQFLTPAAAARDWSSLLPWVLLLIVLVTGCAYTWYDRRKKLHEDGV